ncbi:MAG: 3-deoxy-manno-octulosonate cytidylyltransferase [Betaproteobacteria bacterium HGW-Betaproteobacteria-22]|nr:MAG: 3-deoxy-manno-octulosonate cytidylyltransferase [Betaproteobacteria bacterium HGW-Betaproteobacteria-22]
MKKLHNTSAAAQPFYVVIPARHASTRLPGKPLLDIAGKPMVVWVAERASASGAMRVVVATDDMLIAEAVNQHGYAAVMTRADHMSGTDRIAEVAALEGWADDDIVVNVQGDEPLIDPALIGKVALELANSKTAIMATACHVIKEKPDFVSANVVKVVLDANGDAMYFSRAPIPYPRNVYHNMHELPQGIPAYRHIGIYAYRVKFLKQYASLKPTAIEQHEHLEQLRVLYYGYKIAVTIVADAPANGVDTEDDLALVRRLMAL